MKRVVTVVFKVGDLTAYSYFTDMMSLKSGDIVVVEAQDRLVVAIVKKSHGLSEAQKQAAEKWIIDKVDLTAHRSRAKQKEEAKA